MTIEEKLKESLNDQQYQASTHMIWSNVDGLAKEVQKQLTWG